MPGFTAKKDCITAVNLKYAVLVAAVICLLPLCAALGDEIEPKMVGSSEVRVAVAWSIAFDKTPEGNVTAKLFGLPSTSYQSAAFNATRGYGVRTDSLGNKVLEFTLPPEKTTEVALDALVQVAYREYDAASAEEAAVYLNASPLVELTDEVRSKAVELLKGAKDEEAVVRATAWVHEAVNYSLAYDEASESSSWVYEHRQGTCDEYSHLLLAVLRSIGIPARFVAGFVYTGKAFGPHAWVEAAVGGRWLPADATYNEALVLDATHIKFAHGRDQNDIKEEVAALGGEGISLKRSANLSFLKTGGFPDLLDIELHAPPYRVGEGSFEDVNATIASKAPKPIAAPLILGAPNITKVVEEERLVYLKPGESVNETWKIIFPARMEEGYVYNFTLELATLGKKAVAYVESQKGGRQRFEEALVVKDLYVKLAGDAAILTAVVLNSGNKPLEANIFLEIGGEERKRTASFPAGEEKKIEFSFQRPERTTAGELKLSYAGQTILQPFEIAVSPSPSPTPAPVAASPALFPEAPPSPTPSPELLELRITIDEKLFAAIGVAIILIAFAVIVTRRRRAHYKESKLESK